MLLSFAVLFSVQAAVPPAMVYADEEAVIAETAAVTGGWHLIGGEWYYYRSDGTLLTNGWAKDSHGWCWMDSEGRITVSRWIKSGGEWYYLKANGYMAASEWAQDSHGWMWMDASGKITKDQWIEDNGKQYYLDANGYWDKNASGSSTSENRFQLSGAVYPKALQEGQSFSISGILTDTNSMTRVEVGVADPSTDAFRSGFYYNASGLSTKSFDISNADSSIKFGQLPSGDYLYRIVAYDSAGSVQVLNAPFKVGLLTGWQKIGADWYYYLEDGTCLCSGWAKDSVGWCWLGSDGRIVKDKWIKVDGNWYYLKPNGYRAANAWAKDSVGWMWMDANGRITKSKWIKSSGQWYYLKSNGYMAANEWAKDSVGWCWMDANGRVTKSKWIEYKGKNYYLNASGYWDSSVSIDGATMLQYDPELIAKIGKQPYSGPCGLYSMAYCRAVIDGKFPLNGYSSYQARIIQGYGNGSSYAVWSRAGGAMQLYSTESSLYRAVYDEIASGKPCIMNCYNPPTGNNHFVAVIGYVKGTTRSNVSFGSFIILDPATGTLRIMGATSYTSPSHSPYGPEIVRF